MHGSMWCVFQIGNLYASILGGLYGQTQIDTIVSQKLQIISYNIYRTIYILDDVLVVIHFFFEIKLI